MYLAIDLKMTSIKITSTGSFLPGKIVTDSVFDERFNLKEGTTFKKSGVRIRHYVENESQVDLALAALSNIPEESRRDIDLIVFAGGSSQQPIPCTASLIQKALGHEYNSIPCFDICSTCLSFVTALDTLSYMIDAGRYRKVLLVSSDIASKGINTRDFNSSILFGDAAAAAILEKTPENETSGILTYNFKTFGEGADCARVRGGSTFMPFYMWNEDNIDDYLFHMDGLKLYEISSKYVVKMFNDALTDAGLTMDDIRLVIPHQASLPALKLIQKKLRIPEGKMLINIENQGNTIASSIPLCLDYAARNKLIERGDRIVLLGTSAGLSIGVMVLEY